MGANGFQQIVNNELPPAVPGDFAGANIKASVVAGAGKFVAPPNGTNTGFMGYGSPSSGYASNYYQPSSFGGFVHREAQALLTAYLAYSGVNIPGGDGVTLFAEGDFWGNFASGATAGQKVYADPKTGALTSNTTGNSVTATGTSATVSSNVISLTPGSGTIAVGQIATGGTLPPGTYVASGSTGTWTLANLDGTAIPNNASAFTVTFYGVQETQFTVMQSTDASVSATSSSIAGNVFTAGTTTGTWQEGQYLSGTGVPANTIILYQISGTTGGAGTYFVSTSSTVTSTTITGSSGQLAKISSWSNAALV